MRRGGQEQKEGKRGGKRSGKRVGKRVEKRDLPTKLCPQCERTFTWRKKWERDWDNVVYCSKRCRGEAPRVRGEG